MNPSARTRLTSRLFRSLPVLVVLTVAHLLFGAISAEACTATSYTATGGGNWTDTSVWSPTTGFPGSCTGDSAFMTGVTITVTNPIPNPLFSLNVNTGSTIDIAAGGSLPLGSIATSVATVGGTIDVQGGSLQLNAGSITGGGTVQIESGATFLVSSGSSVTVATALNNLGLVSVVNSGSVLVLLGGGIGGSASTFSAVDGRIDFDAGTYTLSDSVSLFTSGAGEIDLDGTAVLTTTFGNTVTASNFVQTAGTINGSGTFVYGMNSQWNGGTQSGSGFTYVSGGAVLTISGTATTTLDGRALTVQGEVDYTGTPGALSVNNGGSIVNIGTFVLEDDSPIDTNGSLSPSFSNLGLLIKSGGSAISRIDVPIANGGTIENAATGSTSLALNGGGTSTGIFSIDDAAGSISITAQTFTVGTGATQTGLGVVDVRTGGTLLLGALFTSSNFAITGGTLEGNDFLEIPNGGTMNWNGGTIQGAPVQVDGSLNLFTGNALFNGGNLFIATDGTMTFESGQFDMEANAFLSASGLFDIQCNCTIKNTDFSNVAINNFGTFQKSDSAPALKTGPPDTSATHGRRHPTVFPPGPAVVQVPFTNEFSATTTSASGTLGFAGGGTNFSSFTATAGNGIDLPVPTSGQSFDFADGSTFSDDGVFSISGGTLNVDGEVTATNLTLTAGTLQGSGEIDAQHTLIWSGGTMAGSGITEAYPPATATIDGAVSNMILDGRELDVQGVANYTSATKTLSVVDSGSILVEPMATFDIQNDAAIVGDGSTTISNEGTWDKSAGTTTNVGPNFDNTGSVLAEAGTMNFNGGFTQNAGVTTLEGGNIGSSSTLVFEEGELNGNGSVNGDVNNFATVQPGDDTMTPGTLAITGNYTQQSSGAFNVKIGGTTAGSQFDQLNVTGSATLDGSITATLINSFLPPTGTLYQVLTFGSHSGDFASKNFPTFSGTQSLTDTLSATADTLSVVSATADLGVTETGPANIFDNQNAVYTVTVTNNGPSAATGVTMTDTVSGVGGVIATSASTGSCTTANPVVCSVTTLNSGASAVFTITVQTNDTPGSITSAATVSSSVDDPNTSNDGDMVVTTVSAVADLAIGIVDDVDPVDVNGTVHYTVTVTTDGPDSANNPSVLLTINNAAAASSSSAEWDCTGLTATGGTCNATNPLTPLAGTTSFVVTVTAPSNGGVITVHGTVSSTTGDDNNANNSATQTTTVNAIADLGITKTGPANAVAGDTISYTITVSNSGPSDANAVIVTDPTPANLHFISNSGACTSSFPCNIGVVPNGGSKTITASYSVTASGAASTTMNTASVSFAGTDPNSMNDSATASTDVACNPQTPDPIAPLPGAINVSPSGTFRWTNTGAATYSVFVGPVGSGCTTLLGISNTASLAYQLAPTTAYEWRVEAVTSGCPTRTSACNNFTTGTSCPVGPPTLISPAEGSTASAPVEFSWSAVPGATSYEVFDSINGADPSSLGTTDSTTLTVDSIGDGSVIWFVIATVDTCSPLQSTDGHFNTCTPPVAPIASVVGEVITGRSYDVAWDAVEHAASYEVDEATDADFGDATTQTTTSNSVTFVHSTAVAKPFFYRVRSIPNCGSTPSVNSPTVRVVVVPMDVTAQTPNVAIPAGGTDPITWTVFVPAPDGGPFNFTASTDQPWVTVVPTAGTLSSPGMDFQLTADPSNLPEGTNTATLILALGGSSKIGTRAGATPVPVSVPVSITLVTPVSPGLLTSPTANTIIVPSIAHVEGLNSHWQSDIRLSNTTSLPAQYRLTFVSGGSLQSTQQTTIKALPGSTIALDDIVQKWYGIGALGDGGSGMLQIAFLNNGAAANTTAPPSVQTVVSSRTYDTLLSDNTSNGTLGQFIPGIPFSSFVGAPAAQAAPQVLSLQQLTQNDSFRTNLGIVEASGFPVTVELQAFDDNGVQLFDLPMSLLGGQQQQVNEFLAAHNITIDDSRLQISVTGGAGKITAFASVIDNRTLDPLLVSAANLSGAGATDFVLPGVANLNSGVAQWRTDMRVFNAGSTAQQTTLTFYPLNGAGAPMSKDLLVHVGEVASLDDVLSSFFGVSNAAGIVHVTTPSTANLVVTGKTFDSTPAGTYGQFIPAVTSGDAITTGGRSLQILQVEDSVRYRTNVGIAEITGKPATVEIAIIVPGAFSAPIIDIPLAAFEYKQFDPIAAAGLHNVYDGRITVTVIDGDGAVTAYGSIVDMTTQDPTYVPAQ